MVGVLKEKMSEDILALSGDTSKLVQCWTQYLGRASPRRLTVLSSISRCAQRALGPAGHSPGVATQEDEQPACYWLGKKDTLNDQDAATPINSLMGLLGLWPSLQSTGWAPAASFLQGSLGAQR